MEASLLIFIIATLENLFYAEEMYCIATQTLNLFTSTIISYQIRDEKGRFIKGQLRDAKGRFITVPEDKVQITLTKDVLDVLVGSLLGDGSLRYNKKIKQEKIK